MTQRSKMLGPDGRRLRYHWEGNGDGRVNVASDLDEDGLPEVVERPKKHTTKSAKYRRTKDERRASQKLLGAINTYIDQLSKSRLPAEVRAMDPFSSHVWVFAAAMTTATVAGQAPFGIFRETKATVNLRTKDARERGEATPFARAGRSRKAMKRYSQQSAQKRAAGFMMGNGQKAIEPFLDHPATDVLSNPNPYQDGQQLLQLTHLWMAVRGECFWVLTDAEGNAVPPGVTPERIWPLGPDCFTPAFQYGTYGDLIGWYYQPPCYMPNATIQKGSRVFLTLPEVVQFKYPNPNDPIRGMSRITAAALGIESDLLIKTYNRSLLKNNGAPRAVLTYAGNMKKADEEAYMRKWKEKFEGEQNVGKLAMLQAGFQYQNIGLSQEDMQYIEQLKWDRDEVLAVMGMPASVLGVTDFINYATQLGQDKNLWDKLILPLFKLEESAIDRSLFFNDLDDTFALFDLTDIEALRAGLADKIKMATDLHQGLRVPPKLACAKVGLEMEPYPTDDKAFVSPLLTTAESVVETASLPIESPVDPDSPESGTDPAGGDGPPDDAPAGSPPESTPPGSNTDPAMGKSGRIIERAIENTVLRMFGRFHSSKAAKVAKVQAGGRVIKAKLTWPTFIKYQVVLENATSDDYRKWLAQQKKETLARFDAQARGKDFHFTIDLTAVLPDPKKAAAALKKVSRPAHAESLEQLYSLAKEEFGAPIFDVTDDRIMRHFQEREKFFAGQVTDSTLTSLSNTLKEGTAAGESIQELRERIAGRFDILAGTNKTLVVARTESAGFMNGIRDQMIGAQGFEQQHWTSAGDVDVRDDHALFDAAGPQKRGFDYLTIAETVKGPGNLTHPHDLNAPAGQVVNCRCFMIPTK